jgi:ribonuclease HII
MTVTVRSAVPATLDGPADDPEAAMPRARSGALREDEPDAPPLARRTRGDAPVSDVERRMWDAGRFVVGIDEVGRGAWAGPVTVAAVVLGPDRLPPGARDSKQLSAARRQQVAADVRRLGLVGFGHADNREVDAVGLAAALTAAARRALAAVMALDGAPADPLVLIDGPHDLVRQEGVEVATMVKGDAASVSIAAASVVAKVERDTLMAVAGVEHPVYGFERNRGYASPEHVAALEQHGPCALHRHSWSPIVRLLQPTLEV